MSELDDRCREQERRLNERSRERLHRSSDILFIDARPQIARQAQRRANRRAWEMVEFIVGLAFVAGFIWLLLEKL